MPSKSKKQQKFMGMVHAYQKGELKNPSPEIKKVAKSIDPEDAKDFAETKHKGLPEKVKKKKESRIYDFVTFVNENDVHDVPKVGDYIIYKYAENQDDKDDRVKKFLLNNIGRIVKEFPGKYFRYLVKYDLEYDGDYKKRYREDFTEKKTGFRLGAFQFIDDPDG